MSRHLNGLQLVDIRSLRSLPRIWTIQKRGEVVRHQIPPDLPDKGEILATRITPATVGP
jgi:hypothetical protein